MKIKKLAFITSLVLCLGSFCGCSDDYEDEDASYATTEASTEEDTTEETTEKSKAEKNTTAKTTTTVKTTTTETTEKTTEAEKSDFVRGKVEGNVYTSGISNFKFTLPDGWTFADDEALLASMNLGNDLMETGVDVDELISEQVVIYDAQAMTDTGENIIIMYENLAKETPNPDLVDADKYIELTMQNLKSVGSVTYTDITPTKSIFIGDDEYRTVSLTGNYSTLSLVQKQSIFCKKEGNYIVAAIYTSPANGESNFEQILANFEEK